MPKSTLKKKPLARHRKRPEAEPEYGGFSFLGLIAGIAIITAGAAYAFGWFPTSFDTASFPLPEMPKIELPHNN